MQIILVLAVGLDWYLLESHRTAWKSAGVFAISTTSIRGAIDHFQAGDFDVMLLGNSIPAEARERLTFLIRSNSAQVPVISIAGSPGHRDSFADATYAPDSTDLLAGMRELLSSKARTRTAPAKLDGISA
jgi:DNA-binding NtrC family response regulator